MTDSNPLVERAREAALAAYAPYSRFSVGCAIESEDGEIAIGSNMENACYRLGVCAELAALTTASQTFGLKKIARIAVTGGNVGPDGRLRGEAAQSDPRDRRIEHARQRPQGERTRDARRRRLHQDEHR